MIGKWHCAIALKVLATLVTERYRGCRHPEAWAQMWQGGQEVMADCPSLTTLFLPLEITIIIIPIPIIIIIANIIVTVIFIFITPFKKNLVEKGDEEELMMKLIRFISCRK